MSLRPLARFSSDTPTKHKPKKAKKTQRKWGDEAPTESDMASLDFSYVNVDSASARLDGANPALDLSYLIDQSSLGTTKDGMYEVKDWEFGNASSDTISQAIAQDKQEKTSSLGALGSMFARFTGGKILTEEDLKPILESMKQHLMKKNVAKEIADKVCEGVGESLLGKKVSGFQCMFFFFYHDISSN